jgi:hypothetical protein
MSGIGTRAARRRGAGVCRYGAGRDFGSADWLFQLRLVFMVEWWKEMVERWKAMAINIKNHEVETHIRELAALRGVSLVTAVTVAVEREIEREKQNQRRKKLFADWLMEISRETGPRMNDGKTSKELMDELYDPETGLPV